MDNWTENKLTALFMVFVGGGLKGEIDRLLIERFDVGRDAQASFPFPPRDFDNAPEEVRELWGDAWKALYDLVSVKKWHEESPDSSGTDIPAAVNELWREAVERFKQRYTPYVAPAAGNLPHLTIIPGGRDS